MVVNPLLSLESLAQQYNVSLDEVAKELSELGVPFFSFLGQQVVIAEDLSAAVRRGTKTRKRQDHTDHVRRVLDLLSENGCSVAKLDLENKRIDDVFELGNQEGGDKHIGLKIQVTNTIQKGGAIQFSVSTELLREPRVDFVVFVCPPFGDRSDFLARRRDLVADAKELGYFPDKPLMPKRFKPQFTDLLLENRIGDILAVLDIGYKARKRARSRADKRAAKKYDKD